MSAPGTGPYLKGAIVLMDGAPIPFLFNPVEINTAREAKYAEKGGLGASHPRNHYVGGGNKTFSFTLVGRDRFPYLGGKIRASVEGYIAMLENLTLPRFAGGIMVEDPPTVLLAFGLLVKRVKVRSVNVRMMEWRQSTKLRRAEISLAVFEVVNENRSRFRLGDLQGISYGSASGGA